MRNVQEELRAAGIALAADDPPTVRVEFSRLARRIRERLAHSIGLVPAGDDVAVPAIAIELGRALADRSVSPVGIVDARGSWSCARALVEGAAPDGTLMISSWLLDNLALLTPRAFDAGAALGPLRSVVCDDSSAFNPLVVDLTGFDHLGEQQAACGLLDAVVLVARGGRTTARQIERSLRDLPDGRGLGVLLTGL